MEHDSPLTDPGDGSDSNSRYLVIARRYRPLNFDQLIGQDHVAQALSNAIHSSRVGHAYLFTGARGVGKTSCARIFAKALNCKEGPTTTPCGECDVCQSVATGEDVDVLEIDGASNRGIEEIRQLRSNISVRPSRARYKIYIIDEVHMLTNAAFNALLKTLEEPPAHVKFMFCTTDPEKMPITVLSRCQRFDFAPVKTASIEERLQHIVEAENMQAEPEAIRLLARRAAGSMRDSQSLLEQLMSFCSDKITAEDVHAMLGTARGGRLTKLGNAIAERNAADAVSLLAEAVQEGVDVGQLTEQLLNHFRDIITATIGCDPDLLIQNAADEQASLAQLGKAIGIETMLAICQILDHAIVRMRQSTHTRTLAEMALVRICQLHNLDELSSLATSAAPPAEGQRSSVRLPPKPKPQSASPPPEAPVEQKKNPEKAEGDRITRIDTPHNSVDHGLTPKSAALPTAAESKAQTQLSEQNIEEIWGRALKEMTGFTADYASCCTRLAISAPNQVVVGFPAGYTLQKESCERPDRRSEIEQALVAVTGQHIRLDFQLLAEERVSKAQAPAVPNRRQRMKQAEEHPLLRRVTEEFNAEMIRFDEKRTKR